MDFVWIRLYVVFIFMLIHDTECQLNVTSTLCAAIGGKFKLRTTVSNPNYLSWKRSDKLLTVLYYDPKNPTCYASFPYEYNQTRYTAHCDPNDNEYTLEINEVTSDDLHVNWTVREPSSGISSDPMPVRLCVKVTNVTVTEPVSNPIDMKEGITRNFICETSSYPRATVSWYKRLDNGDENIISGNITSTYQTTSNSLIVTTSTLYYNAVREDQDYIIYCKATNSDDQSVTSTHQPKMNVLYRPEGPPVIHSFNNGTTHTIIENETLSLTCLVTGGNPRPTLSWTCNGGTVSYNNSGNETKLRIAWVASRGKDGPCMCTSQHSEVPTDQSCVVNVEVLYPPTSPVISIAGLVRMETVRIMNNTDVPVTCSSSGKPEPAYTWQYKGTLVNGNSRTLRVTENSSATCTATNTMTPNTANRSSSSDIGFRVLYGPTIPEVSCMGKDTQQVIDGQNVDVIHGDNVTLVCSSIGDPEPTCTWNGTNENSVIIRDVQANSAYFCTANNNPQPDFGHGTSLSTSKAVNITRLYAPTKYATIAYSFTDGHSGTVTSLLSVLEDSSFIIVCNNSDSLPLPTYIWVGDRSSPNGFLEVSTIKRSSSFDASGNSYYEYKCIVQNSMTNTCGDKRTENTQRNQTLRVNVLYPPSLRPLNNHSILEGTDFKLTATINTYGSPRETHKWIYAAIENSGGTILAASVNHTIRNISRSQAGIYTFEATNRINQTGIPSYSVSVNESFFLNVFYPSTVSNFTIDGRQGNVTVEENETDIVMRCYVNSNPLSDINLNSNTYKGRIEISNMTFTDSITYTLQRTTCFDAGIYSCIGKNNYTSSIPSKDTHLFVKCTPRPRYPIEHNVTVYKALEESVTFNLTVIAYPEPSPDVYQWVKQDGTATTNLTNGQHVKINSTALQSRLTILNLTQTHFGQYVLKINYGYTVDTFYYYVSPTDKPGMPAAFTHIPEHLSQTTAVFKWEPGFNGGLLQVFYILYKKQRDSEWRHENVSEPNTNITLTGLVPGTLYSVKMFAGNRQGNSSETVVLNITTSLPNDYPTTSHKGPIIGGTAGGGLATLVIVIVLVVLLRRKNGNDHARYQNRKTDEGNTHDYYNSGGQLDINRDAYYNVDRNPYEELQRGNEQSHEYGTLAITGVKPDQDVHDKTYENLRLSPIQRQI